MTENESFKIVFKKLDEALSEEENRNIVKIVQEIDADDRIVSLKQIINEINAATDETITYTPA